MIEPRAGVIFTLNHVSEAISKLAICLSSCHDEVAGFLKAATFLGEVGDKIGMVAILRKAVTVVYPYLLQTIT